MRDETAIEKMMKNVGDAIDDNEDDQCGEELSVVWDVLTWVLDPQISDANVTNYIPED